MLRSALPLVLPTLESESICSRVKVLRAGQDEGEGGDRAGRRDKASAPERKVHDEDSFEGAEEQCKGRNEARENALECQALDARDVRAQLAVDRRARDAEEDAKVPRAPTRLSGASRGRSGKAEGGAVSLGTTDGKGARSLPEEGQARSRGLERRTEGELQSAQMSFPGRLSSSEIWRSARAWVAAIVLADQERLGGLDAREVRREGHDGGWADAEEGVARVQGASGRRQGCEDALAEVRCFRGGTDPL